MTDKEVEQLPIIVYDNQLEISSELSESGSRIKVIAKTNELSFSELQQRIIGMYSALLLPKTETKIKKQKPEVCHYAQ